jgi:AcrR family transcriptional regulator
MKEADALAMAQRRSKAEIGMEHTKPDTPSAAVADDAPHSPHYRRARRDRGAETRAQLIEAALDVFGRLGYEGATTREIAKAANANLAAIVYHFGGKEALHVAVAEYVEASILAKVGSTLAAVAEPAATASPEAARAALHRHISAIIDAILGSAEVERWARFIVREQLQPTAAFEVIYRFQSYALNIATRLLAKITGQAPDDETVKLRVMTVLGQIVIFGIVPALVLRRMRWTAIGEREREVIKQIILENVDAFLKGAKS